MVLCEVEVRFAGLFLVHFGTPVSAGGVAVLDIGHSFDLLVATVVVYGWARIGGLPFGGVEI